MKTNTVIISILLSIFAGFCTNPEDPTAMYLLALAGTQSSTNPENIDDVEFTVDAGDVNGSDDFFFQTTKTINVFVQVVEHMQPVTDVLVQVTDLANGDRVLYKAVTTENGSVNGSFSIDTKTDEVALMVIIDGETLYFTVNIENVQEIRRNLFITARVTPTIAPVQDDDGDGINNEEDQFPNDASRATTIRIPAQGYYTVAFEDLYPRKGDADFNDYVVRLFHEEDLNAQGEVVRIRGYYTHIARGAGYRHRLKLNIGNDLSGNVNIKLKGTTFSCNQSEHSFNSPDLQAIEIYNDCLSNHTIISYNGNDNSMANIRANEVFKPGMQSEIEVVLEQPVNRQSLGSAPYDLFLDVVNTKKEIHFAGRQFDESGQDIYLDTDGFPWALLIPGNWQWPYERNRINNGYHDFEPWYKSSGQQKQDWYLFPDADNVFNNSLE